MADKKKKDKPKAENLGLLVYFSSLPQRKKLSGLDIT